jgi:uncharacterized protein (TIGR00375 family)
MADLHMHSSYSRATSSKMNLQELSKYAKIKGLDILGTGDFTHPVWLKEIKSKLTDNGNGVYDYDGTKFILSGEISLIYKQDQKQRRIHHVILADNFEVVDQIVEWLKKKGRIDYDGRPIFGFSSVEFAEAMMNISKDIMIIPAHAWTPWYGIFGSMSGFDSVEECFQDKAKYIYALETGLSSDPMMNWRLSKLDKYTLVSNSDSHSPYPWRLGREANAFDLKEISYKNLIEAIKTKKNFLFTIEVNPSYGKYHYDGHRNCNFSCSPEEAIKLNNICPKCNSSLTIGVLHRVEELADRKEGFKPKGAVDYKSIIPLSEVISIAVGTDVFTKKVWDVYNQLIEKFGNEFNVLLNADKEEIRKIVKDRIADLVIKNREEKIKIIPGYDGVYGEPMLTPAEEEDNLKRFLK